MATSKKEKKHITPCLLVSKQERNCSLFLLFSFFVFSFFFSPIYLLSPASSQTLPLLQTKQDPFNVIYLSKDGTVTYYQTPDGKLSLSKNYIVSTVLQGKANTRYTIAATSSHRKLLIMQDEAIHTVQNIRKSKKIYQTEYGFARARLLGQGTNPKLHLNDLWASFYIFEEHSLYFVNLDSPALNFKIKLRSHFNPYFIPEHIMVSSETIYYTALNEKGETAIFEFNRQTQKHTQVFKTSSYNQRIELCFVGNTLYFGRFPFDHTQLGSSIETLKRPIYQSSSDDLGHMICNNTGIYFIKNYTTSEIKIFKDTFFDIAFLDFNTLKTERKTQFRFLTNMTEMDGSIFIPYEGKIYVLSGQVAFLETLDPRNSLPFPLSPEASAQKNIVPTSENPPPTPPLPPQESTHTQNPENPSQTPGTPSPTQNQEETEQTMAPLAETTVATPTPVPTSLATPQSNTETIDIETNTEQSMQGSEANGT